MSFNKETRAIKGPRWASLVFVTGLLLVVAPSCVNEDPDPEAFYQMTGERLDPCKPYCFGKACGDDGCGGSCGTCGTGQFCNASGSCGTTPPEGTWYDQTSGLLWQVTPTGGTKYWSAGKTHCEDLVLGGLSDWRLPTIKELRSLIRGCPATMSGGSCNVEEGDCLAWGCRDGSCSGCEDSKGPGNNGMYWPVEIDGSCCYYWSSSPVEDYDDDAWGVRFNSGFVSYGYVLSDGHVRCVR